MNAKFHAAVIGGGIAGMEASLNLAAKGYRVLIIEKDPSIGGNMIGLSKVFPTLDCSSCITTPKMSEVSHNDYITIMTYTEAKKITRSGSGFEIEAVKKPRFVNEKKCIGCRKCEDVCPVYVKHEFERGLGAKKAVCIPFTTAIPQIAVLDPKYCIQCGKCYDVCPTEPKSIDFDQKEEMIKIEADTVIMATGYELTDITLKKEYSTGAEPNVVTAFQMERMLAPSGPFGSVMRPGDGKEPANAAFVLCAGSRDKSINMPYCSRVCCMYSIKQAMLLSGAMPMADITIYYMDIRAFGKGYEQFYRNAEAMGIKFRKAKVAKITQIKEGDLELDIEDLEETGNHVKVVHDLVILANGIKPGADAAAISGCEADSYGFIKQPSAKFDPSLTTVKGLFFCGTAGAPKDIVDTITEAGAAAVKAANYIRNSAGIIKAEIKEGV